jgi:hypothetical protein
LSLNETDSIIFHVKGSTINGAPAYLKIIVIGKVSSNDTEEAAFYVKEKIYPKFVSDLAPTFKVDARNSIDEVIFYSP